VATDYDAPRGGAGDVEADSLEELAARRDAATTTVIDIDETATDYQLPGADILDEDLTVAVVPMLADEFRCDRCFLVHHRRQLATTRDGAQICRECA
jgi:hypothetical protein